MSSEMSQAMPPASVRAMDMARAYQVSRALFVATSLGIPDLIATGRSTSAEISSDLGANVSMMHRLLRALAALDVLVDEGEERFSLTDIGRALCKSSPDSVRDFVLMHGGDQFALPYSKLKDCILTGKNGHELLDGEEVVFASFGGDAEYAQIFDGAMSVLSARNGPALAKAYDFSTSRHLIDVGGGQGQMLCSVLKSFPQLHGTVFDMPRVADKARARIAREGLSDRCDFIGGDMFAKIPVGGDVYLLSQIIHDWDDERSIQILNACRQALRPDGSVLIWDRVMSEVVEAGPKSEADHLIDLTMLVFTAGGLERTKRQFATLIGAAGLRMETVIPTEAAQSVIVCKVA
jgi:SAM-dependent methyltransferase